MARGRFITFEGIEGVGKTTQFKRLGAWLQARKCPLVVTREPGGTALGERLRELLLAPSGPPMASLTELLLMFAARAEHLSQIIRPNLDRGNWVLSDRFIDASYAYQGGGRQILPATVAILEQLVLAGLTPDMTILLDAPPAIGLQRAAARRGAPDRFEQERVDFYLRVRQAYLARAEAEPARVVVFDAAASEEQVAAAIAHAMAARFPL